MLAWLWWLVSPAWASGLVEVGEIQLGTSADEAVVAAGEALAARRFEDAAAAYGALADAGGGVPARVAQAVALYEAGLLRPARGAAEQALAKDPKNIAALNVLGLAMVDSGVVEGGIAKLEEARRVASGAWKARVLVNLGLAHYDRGDAGKAVALFEEARPLAAGDPALEAAVADGIASVAALSGKDAGVGSALGKGDVRGARARAEKALAAAPSRRERVLAELQLAAVERAEGRLEASRARLERVVKEAREAGMVREVAVGLGNLGLVHSLSGRFPLAADALRAGVNEAHAGGYRVVEVDLRCEVGIVLVHLDQVAEAEAEQRAAGALLASMDYPQGVSRQAELGGLIAAAKGDTGTAEQALSRAVTWHEGLGRWLDAARVATSLSAAWQPKDPAKAQTWATRAEADFAKAGDPLGPAHVAMARALAQSRAKDLEGALGGFGRAAELAGKVGGERAQTVARVARENAAQTLVMLGSSEEVARLAAEKGLGDLVGRQAALKKAFTAYDAGLAAYQAQGWEEARARFQEARQAFDALDEAAYALRARRAAAWAVYNHTVTLPVAKAAPTWTQLVEEAGKVEDPELFLRTYAAAALAAHTTGQGDPVPRLVECTKMAERQGLRDVGARCHGALAERDGDLAERAGHARAAHALLPADRASVYALYVVAVDAYNAGRNDLAVELATLARPNAGTLAGALDDVLAAAKQE